MGAGVSCVGRLFGVRRRSFDYEAVHEQVNELEEDIRGLEAQIQAARAAAKASKAKQLLPAALVQLHHAHNIEARLTQRTKALIRLRETALMQFDAEVNVKFVTTLRAAVDYLEAHRVHLHEAENVQAHYEDVAEQVQEVGKEFLDASTVGAVSVSDRQLLDELDDLPAPAVRAAKPSPSAASSGALERLQASTARRQQQQEDETLVELIAS